MSVVNKGVFILVATLWETYCEDLAQETLLHLVQETSDPNSLPKELKKRIAQEIKRSDNELSSWQLAGEGWRQLAQNRAQDLQKSTFFNTPKSSNVDEYFWQGGVIR